jgi:protein-L-isoaspartate(D-aspartate) O-methyltransferase
MGVARQARGFAHGQGARQAIRSDRAQIGGHFLDVSFQAYSVHGRGTMLNNAKSDECRAWSCDFSAQRLRMVETQLRARGITDQRVLQAMETVPREEFVSEIQRAYAYHDCPLPIGFGQTISQPFTVAFQCEALKLQGQERVLEVGTGSGYAAAVLSHLAAEVYTIERVPRLAAQAESTLRRLGLAKVHCFAANGTLGLPGHAPFDGIVVTAGGNALPKPFLEQLAPGGRIVMPIGDYLYGQAMYRFTKMPDELRVENLGGFAFVPLIGQYGWDDATAAQ